MLRENTARAIPIAPASEPKPIAKKPRAKRVDAPAFPDPRGHRAKEAIGAMFPRVTDPSISETTDPIVAETIRRYQDLGEREKEIAQAREVEANRLRLSIRGFAGIECGEYVATWSEARGAIDYSAILSVIRAAHPECGETIDQCLSEAENHVGPERGTYRAKGCRRLAVKRGER